MSRTGTRHLVVAGNGMVGHRFVDELTRRDRDRSWQVTVIGEEQRPAYDRVALSSLFDGATEDDLALADAEWYAARGVDLLLGTAVTAVDTHRRMIHTPSAPLPYDHLVLATGSAPFVPSVPGTELPGVFVYRTIDDLQAIRAWSGRPGVTAGAVIGGGLLGLEAANALRLLGLDTDVVEIAPRLMPLQLCADAGSALRARIEALGVRVHTAAGAKAFLPDERTGAVAAVRIAEGEQVRDLSVGIVVISAGVRPRDELARAAGLAVAERGGVLVDERCRTGDPAISAIGECAHAAGRVWGLVAPGYAMARVAAEVLMDEIDTETEGDGADGAAPTPAFRGADLSTKLKLLGVDVASFGDALGSGNALGSGETGVPVVWRDDAAQVYRRIVLSSDGSRVLGGVLVGDASGAEVLTVMARGDAPVPVDARLLVLPADAAGAGSAAAADGLPAPDALVCSCNNVCAAAISAAVDDGDAHDLASVKRATTAGTGCGGCVPLVKRLVDAALRRSGAEVSDRFCEHFALSRAQLFDIVRVQRIGSFAELLAAHGTGRGCEVCKPAVASMLASLGNGYILDGEQASLQDTNDHFLANIQRDGTYSVVPRLPGGEVTPEQLIAIGGVAREFALHTKITGGQRIDLFGARAEQLPAIWARLVDAGMESGHAYGKALRTVKSCVGTRWCRFGVQDSTEMAVRLELRYRGLRAPHKLKMAVSGCVRECAEAQGKDVGVIATERGWNLWVCGNGGMRPRHADLLAEDLDDATLVRTIDRFLAFYVRTADRLERTSTWLERRPGGIAELRRVLCDDSLGIGDELDALIEHHVRTYRCEWTATLADPARLALFTETVHVSHAVPVPLGSTRRATWVRVAALDDLVPDRGRVVQLDGERVAVFRTSFGEVFAVSDHDPCSGTAVMARGLIGSVGARPTVASPMYKQRFDLRTGECLDDPTCALATYTVRVRDGAVEIATPTAGAKRSSAPVRGDGTAVEREPVDARFAGTGAR